MPATRQSRCRTPISTPNFPDGLHVVDKNQCTSPLSYNLDGRVGCTIRLQVELMLTTSSTFHTKVSALRPTGAEGQLVPGSVFIAVLKHDKKPTDILVQSDVVW